MSFRTEIRDRLVANNVGVFGVSIFISSRASLPTGAGPYLSLIETGGSGGEITHNGTSIARPTMSLTCRAATEGTARTMIEKAYNALGGDLGLYNVMLGSTFYLRIKARQNVTDIGLDDVKRIMFAFNIEAQKQPS